MILHEDIFDKALGAHMRDLLGKGQTDIYVDPQRLEQLDALLLGPDPGDWFIGTRGRFLLSERFIGQKNRPRVLSLLRHLEPQDHDREPLLSELFHALHQRLVPDVQRVELAHGHTCIFESEICVIYYYHR